MVCEHCQAGHGQIFLLNLMRTIFFRRVSRGSAGFHYSQFFTWSKHSFFTNYNGKKWNKTIKYILRVLCNLVNQRSHAIRLSCTVCNSGWPFHQGKTPIKVGHYFSFISQRSNQTQEWNPQYRNLWMTQTPQVNPKWCCSVWRPELLPCTVRLWLQYSLLR